MGIVFTTIHVRNARGHTGNICCAIGSFFTHLAGLRLRIRGSAGGSFNLRLWEALVYDAAVGMQNNAHNCIGHFAPAPEPVVGAIPCGDIGLEHKLPYNTATAKMSRPLGNGQKFHKN